MDSASRPNDSLADSRYFCHSCDAEIVTVADVCCFILHVLLLILIYSINILTPYFRILHVRLVIWDLLKK